MTVQLTHFSAAFVFALFASIVFGITHRETTREMVQLRSLLFRYVSGRGNRGRLGDVVVAKIATGFQLLALDFYSQS